MNDVSPLPKRNTAFTLIELLITVSIIAVLSGIIITIINPSQLNAKARDSKRANNLKAIQDAIELYRLNNGTYPLAGNWVKILGTTDDALSNALVGGTPRYIDSIPLDPSQTTDASAQNPCTIGATPDYRFQYRSDDGSYFLLTAQMEVASSVGPNHCSTLRSWSAEAGCNAGANLNCYGLENKVL